MIRFILHAISKSLSFSKVEARGTLTLLVLLLTAATFLQVHISNLKSASPEIKIDSTSLGWIVETQGKIKEKETKPIFENPRRSLQPKKKTYAATDKSQYATKKESAKDVSIPKLPKDINVATPDDLQRVRGIGPVLSERIIKFRDLLGGFSSNAQIEEVYGLDSLVVSNLLRDFNIQSEVQKIPINTDSLRLLAAHPYISFDLARIIINYRKAHGDIQNPADLEKIKAVDEETFKRLKPYLE